MAKKLQTLFIIFACVFSILYGSEEQKKRHVYFTSTPSVGSKYPAWDFRNWARPKMRAFITLEPGESVPSGYVQGEDKRFATKDLPISGREELYNKFISGYGPSDKETQEELRYRRPLSIAEDFRREFVWHKLKGEKYGEMDAAEREFLEKVEQQTPESYVKPRKIQPLFSSYESPASSSSISRTGFWTKFLTWLGWYKPTYIAPQTSVSESLKSFKPLQQASE